MTGVSTRSGKAPWYYGLIPSRDDEEEVVEELFGRNEAREARLNGWNRTTLIDFVGAKANLVIQKFLFQDLIQKFNYFEWSKKLQRFVRKSNDQPVMKLADLYERSKRFSVTIGEPITVQVLAKKAIFVMFKEGKVFTMGKLLIGDESGIAALTVVNDSIAGVYNKLDIADHIVIHGGCAQLQRGSEHPETVCLNKANLLPLEIKLRTYETRYVYQLEGDGRPIIEPSVFPLKGTYTPGDFWSRKLQNFFVAHNVEFLNMCGIISYVSCITRVSLNLPPSTSSKPNPTQYFCYRWIHLVDLEVKKPLCIKLFLNSLNWSKQKDVVPGTAIVVTNVKVQNQLEFGSFFMESTFYSQVYVNKDIPKGYLSPIPKNNRDVVRKIVSPTYCSQILSRTDVQWAAGGLFFVPPHDPRYLQTKFEDEMAKEMSIFLAPPRGDLARREETMCLVRGYVFKIERIDRKADDKLVLKLHWVSKKPPCSKFYSSDSEHAVWISTAVPDYKKLWFAFPKELPPPCNDISGVFDTLEKNREVNVKICAPLLLPSSYTDGDEPHLNELPLVGGDTSYILWIADTRNKCFYTCIWRGSSAHIMESKVQDIIAAEAAILRNNTESPGKGSSSSEKPQELPAEIQGNNPPIPSVENDEKAGSNFLFMINFFRIEKDDPAKKESNLIVSVVDFVQAP